MAAATAPEVEPGIQGPHIARGDAQVDLAVVIAHRADPGVVEVALGAQYAFGLIDQAARIAFARSEQQLVADDRLSGSAVQVVREPEQLDVVLRVLEIEDVLVVDQDLTDHRTGALELRIGRNARRLPGRAMGGWTDRGALDPGPKALGGGALRARERRGLGACARVGC